MESHAALFYKYVRTAESDVELERLVAEQRALCVRLGLLGRLLISTGGVNGALCCAGCGVTSAAKCRGLGAYIDAMEALPRFSGIDWKRSSSEPPRHPSFFGELTVRRVNEIVATNRAAVRFSEDGSIEGGGRHLSPAEWHAALLAADDSTVIVDVRNTFEHAIGHFETHDGRAAIEPGMQSYTEFESWAEMAAESLREKRVLMFCTGGVRCETASAMLRSRGVADVSQLSGGIHRYVEQFPSGGERGGLFKGRNFVFDQRVSTSCGGGITAEASSSSSSSAIVGRCLETGCGAPYDELCGARVCCVCRDFVLVCPSCTSELRELHCRAHQYLRTSYFALIDGFTADELDGFVLALGTALATGAAASSMDSSSTSAGSSTSTSSAGTTSTEGTKAATIEIPQLRRNDAKRVRKHIARLKARAAELRAGRATVNATWRDRDVVDWALRCHSCGDDAAACAARRAGLLTRCAAGRTSGQHPKAAKKKGAPWVKPPRRTKKSKQSKESKPRAASTCE